MIHCKRHFELSTGDVIMNIAVSFSLHFVENMLNMSFGSFSKRAVLYLQSNYILYHFKHFSAS